MLTMLKSYLSKLLTAVFMMASFALIAQSDATVTVGSGDAAGDYPTRQASFGPGITADVTAPLSFPTDTSGATTVCNLIDMDLTGTIALVDRGGCAFVTKVQNAQSAGAMAVIVCNSNAAVVNQAIVMGGDDMGTLSIPSVMLSFSQCETIRAGDPAAMVTLSATPNPPGPGEGCSTAEVISTGTHTIDTIISGLSGLFGSGNAKWYSYTPTTSNLATITNCGAAVDSRVTTYFGCDVTLAFAQNDDCDYNGGVFSSELTWVAEAGTEYLISWDDRWSDAGFDWTLSEGELPTVSVTVTVDMKNETVDPAGVFLAGTHNEWMDGAMTDNGDGTWTATLTGATLDTIQYKFKNGPDVWESGDLSACGVDDGFGGSNRAIIVNSTEDFAMDLVCFNSCMSCTVTDCNEPFVVINDDIESYTEGEISGQAPHWVPWPGGTVGGQVSTALAQDAQSVLIDGTIAGQDALFLLGDKTEGHYMVSWDMYVPSGNEAYYNVQHLEATGEWAFQLTFDGAGTVTMDACAAAAYTFSYPSDQWFRVTHLFDVDNDMARLIFGESTVAAWPFTCTNFATGGTNQIGAVNFFPTNANNLYYVDNLIYQEIPAATEGNYCYTAVAAAEGINTTPELTCFGGGYDLGGDNLGGGDGGEKGYWFTWTAPGDGVMSVSSCGGGADTRAWIFSGADCTQLSTIGINDDQCDLGDGNIWATYREAAVTSGTTYYILWDNAWEATGFDWELGFTEGEATAGDFCQTAIPVEAGGEYDILEIDGNAAVAGPNINTFTSSTTPYTESEWYTFTPEMDGLATISACDGAGSDTRVWVYSGDCSSFESLTLVGSDDDGCGGAGASELQVEMTGGTTYYIEWDDENADDAFTWTFDFGVPTVNVTLTVQTDLLEMVSSEGLLLSGSFNGWSNPGMPMTDNGDGSWSVTAEFPANTTVEYKFQNGTDGWEDINTSLGGDGCILSAEFGNRFVETAGDDVTVDAVCFNSCVSCDQVSDVIDPAFAAAIQVFPNPASGIANIQYNFDESLDLTIQITNTLGQAVQTELIRGAIQGTHIINVSDLAAGVYMVRLTDGVRTAAQSLVIE